MERCCIETVETAKLLVDLLVKHQSIDSLYIGKNKLCGAALSVLFNALPDTKLETFEWKGNPVHGFKIPRIVHSVLKDLDFEDCGIEMTDVYEICGYVEDMISKDGFVLEFVSLSRNHFGKEEGSLVLTTFADVPVDVLDLSYNAELCGVGPALEYFAEHNGKGGVKNLFLSHTGINDEDMAEFLDEFDNLHLESLDLRNTKITFTYIDIRSNALGEAAIEDIMFDFPSIEKDEKKRIKKALKDQGSKVTLTL